MNDQSQHVADAVIARIIAAARARAASRAASAAVSQKRRRKTLAAARQIVVTVLVRRKTAKVRTVHRRRRLGGRISAKQGRDRNYASDLATTRKSAQHRECDAEKDHGQQRNPRSRLPSLGCGIGPSTVSVADLRYDRIILLADAD